MAIILDNHKIAFFNIPKCASTSVKHALYMIEYGKPYNRDEHGKIIHQYFEDTSPVKEEDFDALKDYWKFTVIRDPAKRILSAYSNRVLHHQDMLKIPHARKRALKRGLSLRPGLDFFLANLNRYRNFSRSVKRHTNPVSFNTGTDLSQMNSIYRINELPRLASDLSERTGMKIEIPHFMTGGPKIDVRTLCRRSFNKLMDHTSPDYELLRDFYEPPSMGPNPWSADKMTASLIAVIGEMEAKIFERGTEFLKSVSLR